MTFDIIHKAVVAAVVAEAAAALFNQVSFVKVRYVIHEAVSDINIHSQGRTSHVKATGH